MALGLIAGLIVGIAVGRCSTARRPPERIPPAVSTSTCACREPPTRPARGALAKRPVPPRLPSRVTDSEATGQALRRVAQGLSPCARSSGARKTLHLEVEVNPSGRVASVRVGNVERRPPPTTIQCVKEALERATLPGFRAREPRRFLLSLAL